MAVARKLRHLLWLVMADEKTGVRSARELQQSPLSAAIGASFFDDRRLAEAVDVDEGVPT